MHELHELRKCLLVSSQCLIHERDHISLAPRNHFPVLAALVSIQDLFYANTGWPLAATCRAASSALAKLGMSRRLAVANLIIARIRSRLGGINIRVVG